MDDGRWTMKATGGRLQTAVAVTGAAVKLLDVFTLKATLIYNVECKQLVLRLKSEDRVSF